MTTSRANSDTWGVFGPRARRRFRLVLLLVAFGGLVYVFKNLATVFLLAGLVAYLLNPMVGRLEVHADRTTATLIVVGSVVVALVGGGYLVGPMVQNQIELLQASVRPRDVLRVFEQLDRQLTALSSEIGASVNLMGQAEREIDRWTRRIVREAPALFTLVLNAVLIPFVSVFLLRDGPRIKRRVVALVPNRYFEFTLEALYNVDRQVGNYFRGLLLEVFVVTLLSIGVLWGLGVQSYVLLGFVAGITTVIPYVGSVLGGSIAVLVHLTTTGDPSAAAFVLLGFLGIQIVDEGLIQPLVFAQTVNLHPLEVLAAVWVGAQAAGALGTILAIPLAGAGKVVLKEGVALIQEYRHRKPGQRPRSRPHRSTHDELPSSLVSDVSAEADSSEGP